MRSYIAVATLLAALCGTAAAAESSQDRPEQLQLYAAERQEQTDSSRVKHEADETEIAERDLGTAHLQVAVTNNAWQRAIQARDSKAAGYWAVQHFQAMSDERDARGRLTAHRAERDIARADFQRDTQLVRLIAERNRTWSAVR